MNSVEAIRILHALSFEGKNVYTVGDIGVAVQERGNTLRSTIKRLSKERVLESVARGIYFFTLGVSNARNTLLDIASLMRPGEYTYESFESAGSEWGLISQAPVDLVTCATTGSTGEVGTSFGRIEYTHVELAPEDWESMTSRRDGYTNLRIASKALTARDLVDNRRSLDLIDWEEMDYED